MTEFQRRLEANIRESLRFAVGEVQDDAVAHMVAGVNAVLNHPCAPAPSQHLLPHDDHRYAVVSSDYSRPFLLGAYATLEAAQLAQCGSPERWPIYERVAAPSPQPRASVPASLKGDEQ